MTLLKFLREQTQTPYIGRTLSRYTGADTVLQRQLIETQPNLKAPDERRRRRPAIGASQLKLTLMRYLDDTTGETAAMRDAYKKMIRDDAVKAALLSKVLAVASLDLSVVPDNPDNPRETKIAEFVKWAIQNIQGGIPRLAHNLILHKLIDGYSCSHIVPYVVPDGKYANKIGIKAIKPKPTNLYNFGLDEFGDIQAVLGQGYNAGEYYDPCHFVISQHMPLYENPMGMSDLRAAYRLYWIKDTAWKLRAIFLEKYAIGSLVGKYTDEDDQSTLEEALQAFRSATYMCVPDDVTVEAIDIAAKGAADYEMAIKDLNHGIFLAITGAILQALEGTQTGARSIGQVHKTSAELFVWALAEEFANDLNKQVVPMLVKLNYAGISNLPTVMLGGVNDEELKASLEVDKGLKEIGWKHSKKDIAKRYRRAWASGPDDELKPEQSQQLFGAAGGLPNVPFSQGEAENFSDSANSLNQLLQRAIQDGRATMERIYRDAIGRAVAGGRNVLQSARLFSDQERDELVEQIAKTLAVGELAGRAVVRGQLNEKMGVKFDDTPEVSIPSSDGIPLLPPEKAIQYFSAMIPGITGDPLIYGPMVRRAAFTLAVSTDAVVLQNVQNVIREALQTGVGGTPDIQEILDAAGVSPANPQYAEMVFRTNMMTSYMQGHEEERQDPEVIEFFPVWSWDTVGDDRVRESHQERNGKYYPASATFQEVRGDPDPAEVINCRCISRAIYIDDWETLQQGGARVESSW